MKFAKYLPIVLCLLTLNSCKLFKKSNGDAQQSTVITDRKWKLVELAGKPVPDLVNGKQPFLMLQKAEGRYSASGGCNGLGGTFTLEGQTRIKFASGMSTKMACENMEIENELTRALTTADNYSISDDNLSLNRARMAPLARFKAVKN